MLVREAQFEDIDQILAIEELSYEQPWPRDSFEAEIGDLEIGFGCVAEEESMVVGFAVGLKVVDEFHLHNIAVHPDYTGIGVGRGLLETIIEYCDQTDLRKILLEVRMDNDAARNLYSSVGFEPVGTRKDYYGPGKDAYLYTKMLDK